MPVRHYVPREGMQVKLRLPEHYRALLDIAANDNAKMIAAIKQDIEDGVVGLDEGNKRIQKILDQVREPPGLWSWFKVTDAGKNLCGLRHVCRALNAKGEPWETVVSTTWIDPPIGWKPIYNIICQDMDQALRVRHEWFKLGIHVWTSHDLSSAGCAAYTPVKALSELALDEDPDNKSVEPAASPHWQYTGNPTETIRGADCEKFFRIKVLHSWEPTLPPTSEKTARRKAIAKIREDEDLTLSFVPDGMGGRMPLCEKIEVIYEPPKETK